MRIFSSFQYELITKPPQSYQGWSLHEMGGAEEVLNTINPFYRTFKTLN